MSRGIDRRALLKESRLTCRGKGACAPSEATINGALFTIGALVDFGCRGRLTAFSNYD